MFLHTHVCVKSGKVKNRSKDTMCFKQNGKNSISFLTLVCFTHSQCLTLSLTFWVCSSSCQVIIMDDGLLEDGFHEAKLEAGKTIG